MSLKVILPNGMENDKTNETKIAELEKNHQAMLNILEDLKENERKDEIIFNSIPDAVFAVDEKMTIVFANQTALDLFAITRTDTLAKNINDICVFYRRETKIAEKDSPLKKAIAGKKTISLTINDDLYIRGQGESFIPIACTASFVANNPHIRAVMVLRDITKEREIDTSQNELISLASHQLRTPLTAVKWNSEMLLAGDAGAISEEQKACLNDIHESNKRMIELVNALLNVSRVDLGTLIVEPEEMSLKDLSDSVVTDLTGIIKAKNLTVKKTVSQKVSKYQGDKKILTVIFQNLISNAVKYTPKDGTVKITIEQKAKGELVSGQTLQQESLVVTVSDNGYGIPEKDKDKIFTKLYRAGNVREIDDAGNGLGLYLVKSMIERVGGTVWFSSAEGKGTTFCAALPAKGMIKRGGHVKTESK